MRDVLPKSPVKSSSVGGDAFLVAHARSSPRKAVEGLRREARSLSDLSPMSDGASSPFRGVATDSVLLAHAKNVPRAANEGMRREARSLSFNEKALQMHNLHLQHSLSSGSLHHEPPPVEVADEPSASAMVEHGSVRTRAASLSSARSDKAVASACSSWTHLCCRSESGCPLLN